jgi:hypothetical protein
MNGLVMAVAGLVLALAPVAEAALLTPMGPVLFLNIEE